MRDLPIKGITIEVHDSIVNKISKLENLEELLTMLESEDTHPNRQRFCLDALCGIELGLVHRSDIKRIIDILSSIMPNYHETDVVFSALGLVSVLMDEVEILPKEYTTLELLVHKSKHNSQHKFIKSMADGLIKEFFK